MNKDLRIYTAILIVGMGVGAFVENLAVLNVCGFAFVGALIVNLTNETKKNDNEH